MDILARIFGITDLVTNPNNFGRISIKQSEKEIIRYKWKILDFNVPQGFYPSYRVSGIFEGFLSGNGMYNYSNYLLHLLKHAPVAERVIRASIILNELKHGISHQTSAAKHMSFSNALLNAKTFILNFLEVNFTRLELNFRELKEDLGKYSVEIQQNFDELFDGINRYNQGKRYSDI